MQFEHCYFKKRKDAEGWMKVDISRSGMGAGEYDSNHLQRIKVSGRSHDSGGDCTFVRIFIRDTILANCVAEVHSLKEKWSSKIAGYKCFT